MTRTISLITATVGAALLFAVPAWGDNWGGDRQDQAIVNAMAEDGFDDAVLAAKQKNQAKMLDARERSLGVSQEKPSGFDARSDGLNRLYGLGEYAPPVVADSDRFRIEHSNDPVTVSASSSREIEWPTIGIGFGIGIVLLLGITLAMKATHTPFAH